MGVNPRLSPRLGALLEMVPRQIADRGFVLLQFTDVHDHGRMYPAWLLDAAAAA